MYEATFDGQARHEFLPRLWAVRKVGFLLDEIRRNGEQAELIAEIRKLGIRHGIVTPYTSFLVVEEEEMLRRRFGRFPGGGEGGGPTTPGAPEAEIRSLRERQAEASDARDALKAKKSAGRGAVAGARMAESLKDAEDAGEHCGVGVKSVAGKTFRLKEGVWVDTALEEFEKSHPDAPRKRVTYLGDEYDQLLADDRLARFLAAGARMKFVFEGTIYEVVEE